MPSCSAISAGRSPYPCSRRTCTPSRSQGQAAIRSITGSLTAIAILRSDARVAFAHTAEEWPRARGPANGKKPGAQLA